ncbi:MAG TPA: WG repeat-containing protein [Pyrinomonadaceae bacterium]|nr:WG repeat-containing protein [Pyrinomonadaceae bacterium]
MKRKFLKRNAGGATLLCLCLSFTAATVAGQAARHARRVAQSRTTPALFPVSKGGKWGFMDAGGRVVIPARFDNVAGFSEGLARVTLGGRPGFVNARGEVVLRPKFDQVGSFQEGLAFVENGWTTIKNIGITAEPGRWGFVDKAGRLAVPLKFTRADSFSEGLAPVQMARRLGERSGFIDRTGRVRIEFPFDVSWGFSEGLALVRSNGAMFYLDHAGRKLPTPKIDDYEARPFSEGLAAVQIKGEWGYIDKTGRLVIAPQFDDAGDFYEGLAAVKVTVDESRYVTCPMDEQGATRTSTKIYGYIDRTGRFVVPPRFEYAGPFSEGLANVSNCSKLAFVDKTGATVLSLPFDDASPFHGGLAAVMRFELGGALTGYVDKTGKVVWKPAR